MSIFRCNKCGCIENTAVSNYWVRDPKTYPLCSECDPKIGKWHGRFKKESAVNPEYLLGSDGFLYHKDDVEKQKKTNPHYQALTFFEVEP